MMKLPDDSNPRPPNLAKDRPQLAIQLGNICCEWSHLEAALAGLFSDLLQADALLAGEAFEFIREGQKKRALAALGTHRIKNKADFTAFNALLGEFAGLIKERNRYVHARWLIEDRLYPDVLLRVQRVGPKWSYEVEPVTENMLAEAAQEIAGLRKKFDALVTDDFIQRMAKEPVEAVSGGDGSPKNEAQDGF